MGEIVGLRSKAIVDDRKLIPEVIELAKNLLEMAESGEIDGLSVIAHCHDDSTFSFTQGRASWGVIGRWERLKRHLIEQLE